MKFLYPQILWALCLLSIPVIIHLFHFRRFKTIFFSNIRFIKSIQQEKKNRNKLKHLLILISRLAAMTAIILAFAQPWFPNKVKVNGSGKNYVSIYLDNSPSMENLGETSTLFEEARKKGIEIVNSYRVNDEFQIISNDLNLKDEKYFNQEKAISLLEELKISAVGKDLSVINEKIKSTRKSKSSQTLYIISDFQKTTFHPQKIDFDSSFSYYFVPVKLHNLNNVYIDSVWFKSPILSYGQKADLIVKIHNGSEDELVDASLLLNMNGQELPFSYSAQAGESIEVEISVSMNMGGWNKGTLSLDDYPLSFDDSYFFSFYISSSCHVLIINGASTSSYLKSVFKTDPYFRLSEQAVSALDLSVLDEQNLVILNELNTVNSGLVSDLSEFVKNGGNLLIIPSTSKSFSPASYDKLFEIFYLKPIDKLVQQSQKVAKIKFTHPIFSGVFEKQDKNVQLPAVIKYYSQTKSSYSKEQQLLDLENGDGFLSINQIGSGNVFLLTVPLSAEWSNFQNHDLFLPVMYPIALYQNSRPLISYFYGLSRSIDFKDNIKSNAGFKVRIEEREFIPDFRIISGRPYFFISEEFSQPGFYKLIYGNNETGSSEIPVFAFNYNRSESEISVYSEKELREIAENNNVRLINVGIKQIKAEISEINQGKSLWKILLIISLVFILTEILLIRFFRD